MRCASLPSCSSPSTTPSLPGNGRQPRRFHFAARAVLLPHHLDDFGFRADKGNLRCLAHLGKIGVFGEKAVARMDGIHVGDFGGTDDLGDVQIAFAAARRADANRFVSESHVQRVAVRLRIHAHGGNSQFLAGANNPQGDFPAVGDKNFLEHIRVRRLPLPAGSNPEQRLPVFHGLPVFRKDAQHFPAHFGFNFVHQLHGFNDAKSLPGVHMIADLHEGLRPGAGRSIKSAHDRRLHQIQVLAGLPFPFDAARRARLLRSGPRRRAQ